MGQRLPTRVVDKAAAYTIGVDRDPNGTIFTNAGATGSVAFTLPTATKALLGYLYEFWHVVDQLMVVTAPTADTLIAFNDVAADSVQAGASGQRIGSVIRVRCVRASLNPDVFKWVAEFGTQGVTFVVNT